MAYTDFFLLPVPKKSLARYRKITRRFGNIIRDFGAISYREFVQDSIEPKALAMLGKAVKLAKDEVVIFSYVDFASKAVRTRAYKEMMKDPRMKKMMAEAAIFDTKRMIYGGFKQIYELKVK